MDTQRSEYYESLSGDVKLRYEEKIKECGDVDPYTLKERDLSKKRADFPEITLLDIGNHMVHSVSPFTKRSFKAYKSMEAYSFFESGFVTNVGSRKNGDSTIIVGKVNHSQRMNSPALKVWVLLKIDGEIICAHCTCIAGLSETCSHVGALCFFVLSITESNEHISVTEILCKWNVPKFKEDSMCLAKDIKWTSASYEELTISPKVLESTFMTSCAKITAFSDDTINNFIKSMPGHISAMHTVLFPNEKRRNSNLKDNIFLSSWYDITNKRKPHLELVEIGKLMPLRILHSELEEISRLTLCKPTGKKLLVALQRGRITGSKFKECCEADIRNPSTILINSLINVTKTFDNVPSVKYRTRNKAKAIKQYICEGLEKHENFTYEQRKLLINPDFPFFAASADGLVSCDCHGKACVEIKCMKILQSDDSFDALTRTPNNILQEVGNEYLLNKSHSYFYQSQMQMHLAEVEFCDLVIWSSSRTSCITIRIESDPFFWHEAKQKALTFHQEVMMPELLAKFYTGMKDSSEDSHESNEDYLEQIGTLMEMEDDNNCFKVIGLEIELLE